MLAVPGVVLAPSGGFGDGGAIGGDVEAAEVGDHLLLLLVAQDTPAAADSLAVALPVGGQRLARFAEDICPDQQLA